MASKHINEKEILDLLFSEDIVEDIDEINGPNLGSELECDIGATIDSSNSDSDTDVNMPAEPIPNRLKKVLPRNRLVNCLDESLSENNYNVFVCPSLPQTDSATLVEGTKRMPASRCCRT